MEVATVAEPREYLGQVSAPYRVIQVSGEPDAAAYSAGNVLFRNASGRAFLLPCVTLGKAQLADLEYVVVRECYIATSTKKAALTLHFSRVGETAWVVPAANNPFSGPTDMEDYLGSIDIATADYVDITVSGTVAYAIAVKRVTDAERLLLMSAVDATDLYMVPTIKTGTPDYEPSTPMTIQFFFRQH